MERRTGIEPARPAWKAGALPLSYPRSNIIDIRISSLYKNKNSENTPVIFLLDIFSYVSHMVSCIGSDIGFGRWEKELHYGWHQQGYNSWAFGS
jgi:hypothetical protein